uniref:Uncharacterized protein n=1 Tax=Cacopsylla melanoneura TaxID=428564 RepID=A0A8D9BEV6_9HEMI
MSCCTGIFRVFIWSFKREKPRNPVKAQLHQACSVCKRLQTILVWCNWTLTLIFNFVWFNRTVRLWLAVSFHLTVRKIPNNKKTSLLATFLNMTLNIRLVSNIFITTLSFVFS